MPAPGETIPGCPPGLEYLTKIDQLLIHQQVELFEGTAAACIIFIGMHIDTFRELGDGIQSICAFNCVVPWCSAATYSFIVSRY